VRDVERFSTARLLRRCGVKARDIYTHWYRDCPSYSASGRGSLLGVGKVCPESGDEGAVPQARGAEGVMDVRQVEWSIKSVSSGKRCDFAIVPVAWACHEGS
jgi:hypothetical protein